MLVKQFPNWFCRLPGNKEDWRQYPRGGRDVVAPLGARALYYGPGFAPPGALYTSNEQPFPRDRFPTGDWRPAERDYRREYERRQQ